MNGVKSETAVDSQSNFEDITVQFKKRCAEVALDKIWLTAAKVWEVVRDELVGQLPKGAIIPRSDQVRVMLILVLEITRSCMNIFSYEKRDLY